MKRFELTTRGHSGAEFNIKCTNHNGLSGIGESYEEVEIPGRDSPLIKETHTRKRFQLEVEIIVDSDDIVRDAFAIKEWLLSDIKDKPIELSDMEGYYFLGFLDNKLDIEEIIGQVGECKLKFNCQSLIRMKSGDSPIVMVSGDTITNNTVKASKPLIKVTSTGNVKFKIGTSIVELKNTDGTIYMDSELMDAYSYDVNNQLVLQNYKMYSDFPTLEPGANKFEIISGTITKFEITPRWRVI